MYVGKESEKLKDLPDNVADVSPATHELGSLKASKILALWDRMTWSDPAARLPPVVTEIEIFPSSYWCAINQRVMRRLGPQRTHGGGHAHNVAALLGESNSTLNDALDPIDWELGSPFARAQANAKVV